MDSNRLAERTIAGLHEALYERIREISDISYETPILDLGCGTGAWLNRLASNGFNALWGVDADINQFAADRAVCIQANLDDDELGLGDKKFGLITAVEIIEHLENPGRLLFHVAEHLGDDGYFLMTTPNIHSVLCRFRFLLTGKLKQFDEKGDPTHIYPVLLPALERVLRRYGLKIIKKWPYPVNGGSITSRGALKISAAILSTVLPNPDPGDILCLLIQKAQNGSGIP